jgi:hypothetical protein
MRRILTASIIGGLLSLFVGPSVCHATTAGLSITTSGNVWVVSVLLNSSSDNKGFSGFDIDIKGTGGITVAKFTPPSNGSGTAFATNPPFSNSRAGGTTNGASEIDDISAFQDTPSAAANGTDAGLVYNLAQITPYPIAHGFFTGTGTLTAIGHPINVFPLNFDVNDQDANGNPLPGNTFSTVAATAVTPGVLVVSVPEPASMVLLGLGGLGLAYAARRRK